MSLQMIKSIEGRVEYVLLPFNTYRVLKKQIDHVMNEDEDYIPFKLEEYVQNPIALARIQARITQEELARYLKVSQAYISKVENKEGAKISKKLLEKVMMVINVIRKNKKND